MIVSVKGLPLGWKKGCLDRVFDYLGMNTMVMEAIGLTLAMDMRWVGMTKFLDPWLQVEFELSLLLSLVEHWLDVGADSVSVTTNTYWKFMFAASRVEPSDSIRTMKAYQ